MPAKSSILKSAFNRDGRMDVPGLQEALREVCELAGFELEQYGFQARFPLFGCKRQSNADAPTVYLSTGMHGDEPAGPLALLEILEQSLLPTSMNFVICPLLNPEGLSLGTRENGHGIDLNRDYSNPSTPEVKADIAWLDKQPRIDLALLLHEDYDSPGFYLNDFVCTEKSASVAERILAPVAELCPINNEPVIDGRPAKHGVACPWKDRQFEGHWTECFYLRKNEAALCFNFESPSPLPLEMRIAGHIAALEEALKSVVQG